MNSPLQVQPTSRASDMQPISTDINRYAGNTDPRPRGIVRRNSVSRRLRHCLGWLCDSVTG